MNALPAVDPALRLTLRGALALLLFWAAAHKLRDVAGFRAALAAYELVPRQLVGIVAAALSAAEIGIGAGLLAPGAGAGGALAAAGLLCVYAGAIAVNLLRGRHDIDCGCVGAAARRPISSALVVRNGLLGLAALASALPATFRGLTPIDAVTIGAGVACLGLLYAAVDGLIVNTPRIAALARDRLPRGLVDSNRRLVDHA